MSCECCSKDKITGKVLDWKRTNQKVSAFKGSHIYFPSKSAMIHCINQNPELGEGDWMEAR